jgi:hypothetical protein
MVVTQHELLFFPAAECKWPFFEFTSPHSSLRPLTSSNRYNWLLLLLLQLLLLLLLLQVPQSLPT